MNVRTRLLGDAWLTAVQTAIGTLSTHISENELEALRNRVRSVAWRDDAPKADADLFSGDYRRYLVSDSAIAHYSAVLIAWPPGHRTPIHDHDGLWGIELVIDGAIAVEEYRRASTTQLRLERTVMLGIGDATAFSHNAYVHACRNLSATRSALSLHIYGGALETYGRFVVDSAGRYRVIHEQTAIAAALV